MGLKVSIVMGSQSDYKIMKLSEKTLKKLGVQFETKIISAHRTPKRMYEYGLNAEKNNIGVIIAAAGGSGDSRRAVALLHACDLHQPRLRPDARAARVRRARLHGRGRAAVV